MRPIVVVLIVLALGTALIAAYLVNEFLSSHTPAQQTPTANSQVGTKSVLVAARDITPGTVLTKDDVRWQPWPETLIEADRFVVQPDTVAGQTAPKDPQQDFIDHIARRSIQSGEPMNAEMVIKQGDSSVTAANIAPGMRAITINVTQPAGVAGLILPGDHVDVVVNTSIRDLAGLEGWKDVVVRYASETILMNLRVVAINQKLSHDPKDGVAEPGNLVTLEVSPQQAEKLLVAQQLGPLSLTLRSMVAAPSDPKGQTFTMDVHASRALASLVALDLSEDEADMPADAKQAVAMAKERAKLKVQVAINRGGTVAIQKFGQ
jgi:pilus assembly protein CpaB